MSTCRMCGETIKMNTGALKYGQKVNLCPRCRAPYMDPKIIELATVSEQAKAEHRMRYAKQSDQKLNAVASLVVTFALVMFASGNLINGFLQMMLLCAGTFVGINSIGFLAKYFVLFPKLANDSEKRMKDTWYLSKMRACSVKAA